MKKEILHSLAILGFLLIISTGSSFGQYYYYNNNYYDKDLIWEVGGSVGSMLAYTDVGRKKYSPILPKNLDWKTAKPNVSFYAGAVYQDVVGVRVEVTYGTIEGKDANGRYPERNLSYKTTIHEATVIGEVYPLMLKYWENVPRLSPYVLGGIGVFTYNPQALYKGRWVDLRPLRTEGQGFKEYPDRETYKFTSVCLPFGGGLKYELSNFFTVRVEAVFRYTFTDYLDDASKNHIDGALFANYFTPQKAEIAAALSNRYKEKNTTYDYTNTIPRGGPKSKDKYMSFNIKFGLNLGRQPIK